MKDFDGMDWDSVLEEASQVLPQSMKEQWHKLPAGEEEMQCQPHGGFPRVAPQCMRYVTKAIMRHAVTRVLEKCMDAEGPQKLKCSWAFAHYKIAFGHLLGKVEPMKFALGFCMRHGHQHGHHHGHHGGHGHH